MKVLRLDKPPLILVVLGTRPEAIKLLPVVQALRAEPGLAVQVVATGQHREMVDQILGPFGLVPDVDLDIMRPDQTINDIVSRVVPRIDKLYADLSPRMVLVQGDTTSAFAAALAAFHRKIDVGHVEAGLRSYDRAHPFPEESNRRMISAVADLHLAATPTSAANLLREGISARDIVTTGNTVIDSLLATLSRPDLIQKHAIPNLQTNAVDPLVAITLHRRENWMAGQDPSGPSPLEQIFQAIASAAAEYPRAKFVYPVHRNPRVAEPARKILGGRPNVLLLDPLPHIPFVDLMSRSTVILTESGGVQEEAPSLGVPVLVARETTERPEAVESGANTLVGTGTDAVLRELRRHLGASSRREGRPPYPNPYGDGRASVRIREAILHRLGRGERPADFRPEAGRVPVAVGSPMKSEEAR